MSADFKNYNWNRLLFCTLEHLKTIFEKKQLNSFDLKVANKIQDKVTQERPNFIVDTFVILSKPFPKLIVPSNRRRLYRKFNSRLLHLMIAIYSLQMAACAHKISIQSDPSGADVWLLNTNSPGRVMLGKTPIQGRVIPHAPMALIEVEKNGFLSKQIAIGLVVGGNYPIVTKLLPLSPEYLTEQSRKAFADSLQRNLEEMKRLQSAISARIPEILELKDLILAGKKVDVLKQEALMKDGWSGISSFHVLMGNYHANEGNFAEAKIRFENALKIDPKNIEAQKRLQGLPGVGK